MTGPATNTPVNSKKLSSKEVTCLDLCARGFKDREIADTLDIALSTVRFHVNNIVRKLGARNKTHAVFLALKDGVLGKGYLQPWRHGGKSRSSTSSRSNEGGVRQS
jgi:DNA-binding NarL/FixJ family response regulator